MNAPASTLRAPAPELVSYTHWMYALHTASALIGILGSATVVGGFIFGVPSLIAVVMNYARRADARGTYLESHFTWQLRTFWYAAVAALVVFLFSLPLLLVLVGLLTFPAGIFLIGVWIIYRVVRGWLKLRDGQPV